MHSIEDSSRAPSDVLDRISAIATSQNSDLNAYLNAPDAAPGNDNRVTPAHEKILTVLTDNTSHQADDISKKMQNAQSFETNVLPRSKL